MKPSLGEDIRSVLAISFGAVVSTALTAAFLQARARPVEHQVVDVEVPVHLDNGTYLHFVPLDHEKKLEVVLMSGPEPLPEGTMRAKLHGRAVTRIELEEAVAAASEARVSEAEASYLRALARYKELQAGEAESAREIVILKGAVARPVPPPGGGQR
jgi:hypothetical protein